MFSSDEKFRAALRDLAEHETIIIERDPELERLLDDAAKHAQLYITEEQHGDYLRVSLHDERDTR